MVRLRAVATLAFALAAGALVAGCGGGNGAPEPHRGAYRDARYGVEVQIPRGWQRARTSLTPHLTDPREILAVATFRPVAKDEACAQFPSAALHHMPRDGALVEVEERAGGPSREFAPRPRHFSTAMGTSDIEVVDCVPKPPRFRPRWIEFRDGQRLFYALVAIGTSAPASTRDEAYELLDSLRFDPHRKASWRRAG
jgi:hypothetical protein